MNPLKNMSDADLEYRLKDLVSKERKLLHIILEHIKEVDSRKLYLARAYSSLYEYLVQELGYSGSAASRRIEAARLLAAVPTIAEKVQDGSLSLSQIGEMSRAIKEKERTVGCKISAEDKHQLVESISGMSTRDTQQQLSQILDIPVKQIEKIQVQQDGSVRLETTLSKEQIENLFGCKDLLVQLLAQSNLEISLGNVIGVLAGERMDKSPMVKASNLTERRTDTVVERVNKTLTPKTRRMVFANSSCCEFKDPKTGRQCKSTFAVQTDHIQSRSSGGNHSLRNLQTLCARHNRYKYQQERLVEMRFFS